MTLPLLFERDGAVAILTLNRPEARNALSPELACRLADAMDEIAADEAIRAVVLTGAGDKAFCSGGDLALSLPLLSGARQPETEWDRRFLADDGVNARIAQRGFDMPKPVIAAVNGPCMAGGMETLLGTDIRIAVPHATFALPEAARGVIPFAGALVRLPRQIPYALAMEMMLTGAAIDAETALNAGLIGRIVEPGALMDTAMGLARKVAANAPVAVQQIKRTVIAASGVTLAEGYVMEDRAKRVVMATEDAREGPRAFMEKRAPIYRGK
ncbi:enoyl-CoA hydratase/isomerase family protein [Cereibacter sphaeroides]|nr:enoyl-CoA hydratase/isomerase family protein [Cereibacter sphaeroides]